MTKTSFIYLLLYHTIFSTQYVCQSIHVCQENYFKQEHGIKRHHLKKKIRSNLISD